MGSGSSKKTAEAAEGKAEAKAGAPAASSEAAAAPAGAEAAPAAALATPAAAETPAADAPYKIVEPPEDFVVEGLKLAGGIVSDHADVREGKVIQVAKHPDEHMMQYWLKVEYGTGEVAFVHTLMSCGWNSDQCIRNVGDAQFPPDATSLPMSKDDAPAGTAEDVEGPHKIVDSPEDFVVQGVQSCGGALTGKDEIKHGKVLQVAKHPQESRMDYWLKVEYGPKIAFVHMCMSCGWTSTEVIEDAGDAKFPPDPKSMPTSKGEAGGGGGAGGAAELPDLKPADYAQEFVCPEHQETIGKDEKLKAAFPEFSALDVMSDMKSIWRGPTGFWLEVSINGTRYGAHYLDPEEGGSPENWTLSCAVKLAEDEEFPPEPRTTRGKAMAF